MRREKKATHAKPAARRKTVRNARNGRQERPAAVEAISPARMIAALDAEIAKITKARDALRELA